MRLWILTLGLLGFVCGCTTPTARSVDSPANYNYVFSGVTAPKPTIVHSQVDRDHRSVFGLFPLKSEYNSNWQFELEASREWVEQVKSGFVRIEFADVWPQQPLPAWFTPSPDQFTAWKLPAGSTPLAHLFTENTPAAPDQIRVFIRSH